MIYHVLYNPNAGNGRGQEAVSTLAGLLPEDTLHFQDMTALCDYDTFFDGLPLEDAVILSGGDGTLNRFLNDTVRLPLERELYYYATGSGNDFFTDIGHRKGDLPCRLNPYLEDLPSVEVNGQTYRFLNGVGYGIDGYCCQEGDRLRAVSTKSVNYTAIAIKGLLFHYKPTAARVTVDGVLHTYDHVWLAPTMHGCHYGGGMIPTPEQKRLAVPRQLSVMVYHCPSKLKTLSVFPSIFKGEHVRHTDMVEILTGREIQVEFDRPTPLQIDGETILGVTSYRAVCAGRKARGEVHAQNSVASKVSRRAEAFARR